MAHAELTDQIDDTRHRKSPRKGLLIGGLLACILGGGGFFVTYSGIVAPPVAQEKIDTMRTPVSELPALSFVPLEPLVVSLGSAGQGRHLRFRASLEVVPGHEAEVTAVLPRVIDVLNAYLRAVDIAVLDDPSALIELRAQMLRRIQLVSGEGRVRDLLILEFVLN